MVVVAPTGVAAINAGGVTMHSFFQLPFTPFVPTPEGRKNLIAKQHMTSVRRTLFRELELLVIDEVSMVRADLLDAVDTVLRHYRFRPDEPFGGVQVIFIGDLYQLSPVVGQDWNLLRDFYTSPYFFSSKVVEQQPPVYIEFDHIFRQTNQQFINLLNEVRNNNLTEDGMELLNRRYDPDFRPTEDNWYITLTTHNRIADDINEREMAKIKSPVFTYEATIHGDFGEKSYPNDPHLELKKGAKVMFIANDNSGMKRYFNGKIGTISSLDEENIYVACDDDVDEIPVQREVWENIYYDIDKATSKIEEHVLGSYEQFPLRLAWAITIHKSQGLTFDKVVIDAEAAFASGQVYVALSRCRTLDGIVLSSPINRKSLAIDENVRDYCSRTVNEHQLEQQLTLFKSQYNLQILQRIFGMDAENEMIRAFVNAFLQVVTDFNEEETREFLNALQNVGAELKNVGEKFIQQLVFLLKNDPSQLAKRIEAASDYYANQLMNLMADMEQSPAVTDSQTEANDFHDRLEQIYQVIAMKVHIISEIRNRFSVDTYFACKTDFKQPRLNIHPYSGDRKAASTKIKVDHVDLYESLTDLRNTICRENNLKVYYVANTKTLVEMANSLPQTPEQLTKIKGFGKIKVQRFGPQFLEVINDYCHANNLQSTIQADMDFAESESPKKRKGATFETTLAMFNQGKSIEQIAKERALSVGTIESHIAKLISQGKLSVFEFVDADDVEAITKAISGEASLTEIFTSFDSKYSYGTIRMVLAHLAWEENNP